MCRSFWKRDSVKECTEVHQTAWSDKETLPGDKISGLGWRELAGEDWGWLYKKGWAERG